MLQLARTFALAGLSLAVIHPMGVAGARVDTGAAKSVLDAHRVVSGSGLGMVHGLGKVPRATTCQEGQYLEGAQCNSCPPGHYCTGGIAQPMACPAGTWNDQSSGTSLQSCEQVQCGNRPTGPNSDGSAATGQTPCGNGFYSSAGSTTCTMCPAGYYCNTDATCAPSPCDPGTYADKAGTTKCKNCQAGTFNNGYANTSCCQCCAGWYNQGDHNHTSCQQCPGMDGVKPLDVTGPPGSSSANNCKVYTGAPGQSRAPATCSQVRPTEKSPGTCPATSGMIGSDAFNRRSATTCALGKTLCQVKSGRGGFECVDTKSSLE
ncbi:hypothetical protein RhiJN_10015 [Ceratobasidium sp. AG-Ba]|nr:hypothetical protein RhiJN_10015 [Ceratobasidium sp. AG-Ba]QRW10783.1 hypothetical protein RhiLY_09782 [Ceratobasidium sp. AG-Ba]